MAPEIERSIATKVAFDESRYWVYRTGYYVEGESFPEGVDADVNIKSITFVMENLKVIAEQTRRSIADLGKLLSSVEAQRCPIVIIVEDSDGSIPSPA